MLSGTPSRDFAACFSAGELVVGVDEAGRGPLAGPVVAAAVVLCKPRPAGLDDSKKLSHERRALIEERIRRRCAFGIGVVEVEHIDALNIFQATMWAMAQAVARLCEAIGCDPHQVLVDGNLTPPGAGPSGVGRRGRSSAAMPASRASRRPRSSPRNIATG
jgi:ribonuclease HII